MTGEDCSSLKLKLAQESFGLGLQLLSKYQYESACLAFRRSLDYAPSRVSTMINLSSALIKTGRLAEARKLLSEVLVIEPGRIESRINLALLQLREGTPLEAAVTCDAVLIEDPRCIGALVNKGISLERQGKPSSATEYYARALSYDPKCVEAKLNLANIYYASGKFKESLILYEELYKEERGLPFIIGALLWVRLTVCDWSDYDYYLMEIASNSRGGTPQADPMVVLATWDDLNLQKLAIGQYIESRTRPSERNAATEGKAGSLDTKILNIGYFSMDLRQHPVGELLSEVIRLHDRMRFRVFAFYYGPKTCDKVHINLERSFDRFYYLEGYSDKQIQDIALSCNLHVAIDLAGFTQGARPDIFTRRIAPIQLDFLGFPGPTFRNNIDFVVADRVVMPPDIWENRGVGILYLPYSYQPNSLKNDNVLIPRARAEFGLPPDEFVFCSFNNTWKLNPGMFYRWIEILLRSPRSVLWIYVNNEEARHNLTSYAANAGLDVTRLIFAGQLEPSRHRERYQVADLMLDTFPYGAHTTAIEALNAGVPIITLQGNSFQSRVASSLLTNLGLSELITKTHQEYEELAVSLFENPNRLRDLKAKLVHSYLDSPIFDMMTFTKNLENAFESVIRDD